MSRLDVSGTNSFIFSLVFSIFTTTTSFDASNRDSVRGFKLCRESLLQTHRSKYLCSHGLSSLFSTFFHVSIAFAKSLSQWNVRFQFCQDAASIVGVPISSMFELSSNKQSNDDKAKWRNKGDSCYTTESFKLAVMRPIRSGQSEWKSEGRTDKTFSTGTKLTVLPRRPISQKAKKRNWRREIN